VPGDGLSGDLQHHHTTAAALLACMHHMGMERASCCQWEPAAGIRHTWLLCDCHVNMGCTVASHLVMAHCTVK
jgi:hypothetical protein